MSKSSTPKSEVHAADSGDPAAYLDMPPDRRVAAKAHAAVLGVTLRKLAAEVPFQADVDDFRRVLIAEAK